MKVQKVVLTETKHIAVGVLIGDALMCLVFALLKKFDYTVLLGALLGSVFAVGSFFLLGLSVQKAVSLGDGAQKFMRATYTGRMMLYVVCILLGVLLPCFHSVAAVVPLFLPQLVIYAMRALGLYKPDRPQADSTQKEEQNP